MNHKGSQHERKWNLLKPDKALSVWPFILICEVFLYSSYAIFINLGRIDGKVEFQSSELWLSVEVLKLLLAVLMAWPEFSPRGVWFDHLESIIPFSVPALCYFVNNNLSVVMQDEMDPSTFQVLCNLKLVSTAILYRIIIKRRLKFMQWVSLYILFLAGGLNSYSGLIANSRSMRDVHLTVKGAIMMATYCLISGFAGVYTEYIVKKDSKTSLAIKNCYMYSFGVILNLVLFFYQRNDVPFLHGFTKYTWAAIITQATNGLVMSFIMKYGSNIMRLFVISSAVPVTAILSVIIFQSNLGLDFLMVALMVVFSICMYNCQPNTKS